MGTRLCLFVCCLLHPLDHFARNSFTSLSSSSLFPLSSSSSACFVQFIVIIIEINIITEPSLWPQFILFVSDHNNSYFFFIPGMYLLPSNTKISKIANGKSYITSQLSHKVKEVISDRNDETNTCAAAATNGENTSPLLSTRWKMKMWIHYHHHYHHNE